MLLVKLVSSECCHTRFDSSGAKGDEDQTHHGQRSAEQRIKNKNKNHNH